MWSVVLMNEQKFEALKKLNTSYMIKKVQRNFMIPGLMTAFTEYEEAFKSFRTPF